ncbi:MAG: SBBP repeat-containing protein [Ignavibacteria bacterium]|nr:SBBP repeat-containing protein [Ignavibacteria bacterium]
MSSVIISQVSREWLRSYNFSSEDADAVAVDNSGNVYVTGMSGTDYATLKYNSSGILLWVSRYNGTGNSTDHARDIAVDSSGNVYVTGYSIGTSFNSDYVTIKYNSLGAQQWLMRYNGSGNGNDDAFSIAADNSGNVYVTGNAVGFGTQNDFATVKYNSAGIQQWIRSYNGTGNNVDFAYRLVLDETSNVYVTGWSRGTGTEDDNFATIKYDAAGTEQWARTYNGPGDGFDQPQSIAADKYGNVYVTGRSPGITTQYDFTTIKYNSSGDSIWVRRFDGIESSSDNSRSVAVDTSGNVYVFGQSYSAVSNYDFLTLKYNSSGVILWSKIFNGPGNNVENANDMALDNSGNVFITGSSAFAGANYNFATVKYTSDGTEQWSDTYNGTVSGSDQSFSIAVDSSDKIYITGTSSGILTEKDFVTIKYSQDPYALITGIIEGFYNSSLNKMISDTVRVYLRSSVSPYSVIDSSFTKCDTTGYGRYYFTGISNGVNYYIVLKHRNSIETWSASAHSFTTGILNYDFTPSVSQAFGNNMIQTDTSPVRFAVYSGM